MAVPIDIYVGAGRNRVLARVAISGIYLLRGLPEARVAGPGTVGAPARPARVRRGNLDTQAGGDGSQAAVITGGRVIPAVKKEGLLDD